VESDFTTHECASWPLVGTSGSLTLYHEDAGGMCAQCTVVHGEITFFFKDSLGRQYFRKLVPGTML
jgi:hypothetical protein